MCLAIPARVVAVNGMAGAVEISGVRRTVSFALIDPPEIGDYVLVHVGNALAKIDEAEAQRTLDALSEIAEAFDRAPVK
ncbi:MAG: HypC/HybG/HupF family hydrogenase formation chaperone [Hyphomonadaceae bacterium]